eukprot:jgi/Ulvmu1/5231/UM022_0024.1
MRAAMITVNAAKIAGARCGLVPGRHHLPCSRAVQARAYESTTEYDYDMFTIGGGSGGVRASRMSSGFGAKVACAELPFGYISSESSGGLGGTCVLRGCVPKKLVMYCSEYAEHIKDAEGFGWEIGDSKLHWDMFMEKKRKELQRLNGVYGNIMGNAGVEVIEGRAMLKDNHTVVVNGKEYTSKYICLAVGGTPHMLGLPGVEHCINSDGILELDSVPKRLAIIGAGYIGVEFGGMFNNFGTDVQFFIRSDKVLKGFDEEVRDQIMTEYDRRGITINNGCSPKEIKKNDDGSLEMTYSTPDGEATRTFDQILMATGRTPNTADLGLEAAGIETNKKGFVVVDEYSKTSVDNVYAVGDITDRMALTPVALMEGMCLAKTLFNEQPMKPDHKNIPTAVFSQPHIGTVGYGEEEAVEKFGDVDVYSSSYRPMRNTISGNESRGFMKILVDASNDKVVGIHIVGPEAGEMMQGFGVAVKMGATKADLDSCVGIHPTAAEELVTMRSTSRKWRGKKQV